LKNLKFKGHVHCPFFNDPNEVVPGCPLKSGKGFGKINIIFV